MRVNQNNLCKCKILEKHGDNADLVVEEMMIYGYETTSGNSNSNFVDVEESVSADEGLMECGCCFTSISDVDTVQCTEGHLFCKNCLQVFYPTQCICYYYFSSVVNYIEICGGKCVWERQDYYQVHEY